MHPSPPGALLDVVLFPSILLMSFLSALGENGKDAAGGHVAQPG